MPPWTYSQLSTFETCPKQYYHKYVAKEFPFVKTTESAWGDRVHLAFESRVFSGELLPDGMTQWEPFMRKLAALPGEKHAEKQLAVDELYRPASYWDSPWTRGKADLLVLHGDSAAVFDYKTGKKRPSDQLTLYAAYVFSYYPQVSTVHTRAVWLKEKTLTKDVVQREELPFVWQGFAKRANSIEQAHEKNEWPERPSGLCRGWCPVSTCRHWAKKS